MNVCGFRVCELNIIISFLYQVYGLISNPNENILDK